MKIKNLLVGAAFATMGTIPFTVPVMAEDAQISTVPDNLDELDLENLIYVLNEQVGVAKENGVDVKVNEITNKFNYGDVSSKEEAIKAEYRQIIRNMESLTEGDSVIVNHYSYTFGDVESVSGKRTISFEGIEKDPIIQEETVEYSGSLYEISTHPFKSEGKTFADVAATAVFGKIEAPDIKGYKLVKAENTDEVTVDLLKNPETTGKFIYEKVEEETTTVPEEDKKPETKKTKDPVVTDKGEVLDNNGEVIKKEDGTPVTKDELDNMTEEEVKDITQGVGMSSYSEPTKAVEDKIKQVEAAKTGDEKINVAIPISISAVAGGGIVAATVVGLKKKKEK